MSDPEFSPQEQEIINRLANAPQPSLNPAAFDLIRGKMLDAMDTPPPNLEPVGRSVRPFISGTPAVAAALVAAILVIGIAVVILNRPTEMVTLSPIPPTAVPTFTSIPPTATPNVIQVVTDEPTPDETPTFTPTATLEPVIVVEGPVEIIVGNVVTIYGIEIVLNADDPLLTVIQVGDVLHIEADYAEDAVVIVAVTVEPLGEDVNVNPDTGEVWRDDGGCANPPPPWAPANGWRRRCEGAPGNADPPGQGQGNGSNNDDDD